jgi:hypothetical protein
MFNIHHFINIFVCLPMNHLLFSREQSIEEKKKDLESFKERNKDQRAQVSFLLKNVKKYYVP